MGQDQVSGSFRSSSGQEMDWKANLSLALGKSQSAEPGSVFSTGDTSSDQNLPRRSSGAAHSVFKHPIIKEVIANRPVCATLGFHLQLTPSVLEVTVS